MRYARPSLTALTRFAAVLALAVCLAAAGLRFASWKRNGDVILRRFDRDAGRRDWACVANARGISISFFRPEVPQRVIGHYDNQTNTASGYKELEAAARTWRIKLWGLQIGRNIPFTIIGLEDITLQGFATQITVPWWLIFVTAAPLPLWQLVTLRRRLRRRRRERGLCVRCGYDLRATPGRCPECGTETA